MICQQQYMHIKKSKCAKKRFSIWRMESLHPAMSHEHDTDFARWLHHAMWHVALGSWQWIHQVAAPCNVTRGSGMTCHWIRPVTAPRNVTRSAWIMTLNLAALSVINNLRRSTWVDNTCVMTKKRKRQNAEFRPIPSIIPSIHDPSIHPFICIGIARLMVNSVWTSGEQKFHNAWKWRFWWLAEFDSLSGNVSSRIDHHSSIKMSTTDWTSEAFLSFITLGSDRAKLTL